MNQQCVKQIKEILVEYKQYPQGLEAFGIRGRRDSDFRFKLYGFDTLLKPEFDVLDLGCNCGFIDMLIAPRVRNVVGFDISPQMVSVARLSAEALDYKNCYFIEADFNDQMLLSKAFHNPFDLVLACQMHHWVNLPFSIYADRIVGYVKEGGFLLFESHDTETIDRNLTDKLHILYTKGVSVVHEGEWVEDPEEFWNPPRKGHKKIPRKFFLLQKGNDAL
jgi:SAM-dependent methyltransferase